MTPTAGSRSAIGVWVAMMAALVTWAAIASTGPGQTDNVYAGVQFTVGGVCFAVGTYVAWHSRHLIGWAFIMAGSLLLMTASGSVILAELRAMTWYARPMLLLAMGGWLPARGLLQIVIPMLYPSGWPGSRPRRIAVFVATTWAIGCGILQALAYGLVSFEDFQARPSWALWITDHLSTPIKVLFAMSIVANGDLLIRVIRMPPDLRRRHGFMSLGAVVLALPGIANLGASAGWWTTTVDNAEPIADTLLPVLIAYGIFRHGALGFQTVVRRTTVYGLLVIGASGVYAVVVLAVSNLVEGHSRLAPALATGLIALGLGPAHERVDRSISRRLFGVRDDPYTVLSELGAALARAKLGADALDETTKSIASQLRLPFVAIDLSLDEGAMVRFGDKSEPPANTLMLPITHAGDDIGRLLAAARTLRDRFDERELALLKDLTRAVGPAARSVQLLEDLRRGREAMVAAREDERRRIRRDLHDGLGPTLASVALGLDAAATRLEAEEADALSSLLRELDSELQHAIRDLRRLVQGLRPPALDDLGLEGALRRHAEDLEVRSSRTVEFVVEADDVGVLPAAVEVAAYRIALEGMTNVVRHANARRCRVSLRRGHGLAISVTDDGTGLSPNAAPGIGLRSMRLRAEEVGGELTISSASGAGTTILAKLPIEEVVEA